LDEAGVRVDVERISDPAGVRGLLPEIVALHRARDRSVGRRSDLDRLSRRAFYVNVVRGLADLGRLDIWALRLDGALGAFVVGVSDHTSYRALDARIADLWPSASPGQLLRTEMITALLAEPGLAELDWLRGELRHKMQDATHVVATEQLSAESSPMVTTALRGWHDLRQGVRDRIPNQVREWIRSRKLSAFSSRSRVGRAAPGAVPVAPPRPGAAGGSHVRS
jgi:CelD/BcsL family acetyltransferase involved in cellulose biosynthesis